MRVSDYAILTGVTLVILGLVLLVMSRGIEDGGFFFVFPFFFVGTGSLGVLLALGAMTLVFAVALRAFLSGSGGFPGTYLRTGGTCEICGHPVPEMAEFCPYCGAPVIGTQNQHDE